MKISLKLANQLHQRKPSRSVERFQKCPACGDAHLIQVDDDVVCGKCAWDSCRYSVDAGFMDNFFREALRAARAPEQNPRHVDNEQPFEKEVECEIA